MKNILVLITTLFFNVALFAQAPSIVWEKTYGGTGIDKMNSMCRTNDGGYIMAGSTKSTDGDVTGLHLPTNYPDFWVVKVNDAGLLQWEKSLGGAGRETANCVLQTLDGGYLVVGSSDSSSGDVSGVHGTVGYADFWVVKLDSVGAITWEKSYGGTSHDIANTAIQIADGSYIVAGYTSSSDGDVTALHGNQDGWLLKIDVVGNILWQKTFGHHFDDDDQITGLGQEPDGNIILAGSKGSSFATGWFAKTDSSGNMLWEKILDSIQLDSIHLLTSLVLTDDNGWVAVGSKLVPYKYNDLVIVRMDSAGNILWTKTYGSNADDFGYGLKQTLDKGYIVSGNSTENTGDVIGNHGGDDLWILKVDSIGNLQWQKSLGEVGMNTMLLLWKRLLVNM